MHPVGARVHLDRDPAQVECELERAPGVSPVVVEVRVADPRHHGLEVLAAQRSCLPLHHRDVRAARGPDVAVAPRLRADPLLGVVPVFGFVAERVPLARRVPAASHVLADGSIPARGKVHAVLHHGLTVVAVRSPNQDRGRRPVYVGQVDVGGKFDPIPHRDVHAEHHPDAVECCCTVCHTNLHRSDEAHYTERMEVYQRMGRRGQYSIPLSLRASPVLDTGERAGVRVTWAVSSMRSSIAKRPCPPLQNRFDTATRRCVACIHAQL